MHLAFNRCITVLSLLTFYIIPMISQSDWQLKKNDKGIQVYTKPSEGSKIHQFKATARIKTTLEYLKELFIDVERMPTWYEGVKSVKTIKKITATEASYILVYDMPYPLTDRITTVRGKIEYEPQILTVSTEYSPYDLPDIKSEHQLVTKIWSKWTMQQIDAHTVDIIHEGFMDPEGSIPDWAVNSKLVNAPYKTLFALKKMLEN